MRLAIDCEISHSSPAEWAEKLYNLGCGAVVLPFDHTANDAQVDAYTRSCKDYGLIIAEVGAYRNLQHSDPAERKKNIAYVKSQLAFADRVGARCCVNIAGTSGEKWNWGYIENYSGETYKRIIDTAREIIEDVKPVNTYFTLEPMPWMVPDSPESCRQLCNDVSRERFAVHLDIVNMINDPRKYFFNKEFIKNCFDTLNGCNIRCCHAKDIRLEKSAVFSLALARCGEGNLDLAAYAAMADACDKDMPFLIEHHKTEEEYINALKYIKNLVK